MNNLFAVEIQNKNCFAIINIEDKGIVTQYEWRGQVERFNSIYPIAKGNHIPRIFMHSLILHDLGKQKPDHINNNPLHNTRNNLRLASNSQNCMNRLKTIFKSSSKYKGVTFNKRTRKWLVRIKQIYIGLFDDEKEAAIAYNKEALILFGEFAKLNIIK